MNDDRINGGDSGLAACCPVTREPHHWQLVRAKAPHPDRVVCANCGELQGER